MKFAYFVLALIFGLISINAGAQEGKTKITKQSRSQSQLAAMMPTLNLAPTQELVKFIPCETEGECYRQLQEVDSVEADNGKFSYSAEFVEAPKMGINVYKQASAK